MLGCYEQLLRFVAERQDTGESRPTEIIGYSLGCSADVIQRFASVGECSLGGCPAFFLSHSQQDVDRLDAVGTAQLGFSLGMDFNGTPGAVTERFSRHVKVPLTGVGLVHRCTNTRAIVQLLSRKSIPMF